MRTKQKTTLNEVLADRKMTGKALARAVDTTEGYVSAFRNGKRPGRDLVQRMTDALNLTEAEIVALGWNEEHTNV